MAVTTRGFVTRIHGDLNKAIPFNDEEMRKGTLEMAYEVERRAKLRAPVDHGRLRGSIEAGQDSHGAFVRTNVAYAAFPEFGTLSHGRQTDPGPTPSWYQHGTDPGGSPAQPYLRPAFYEVVHQAAAIMKRVSTA